MFRIAVARRNVFSNSVTAGGGGQSTGFQVANDLSSFNSFYNNRGPARPIDPTGLNLANGYARRSKGEEAHLIRIYFVMEFIVYSPSQIETFLLILEWQCSFYYTDSCAISQSSDFDKCTVFSMQVPKRADSLIPCPREKRWRK